MFFRFQIYDFATKKRERQRETLTEKSASLFFNLGYVFFFFFFHSQLFFLLFSLSQGPRHAEAPGGGGGEGLCEAEGLQSFHGLVGGGGAAAAA